MASVLYFDLDSARRTLKWLKAKISEMNELSQMGVEAMEQYDMESADTLTLKIQSILDKIRKKGIVVRDQDATLFDFPAVIDNIPSYLCWSIDEDDIEYWHYADEGFSGRTRITGQENILSYL
jgi:hypothetical protein